MLTGHADRVIDVVIKKSSSINIFVGISAVSDMSGESWSSLNCHFFAKIPESF